MSGYVRITRPVEAPSRVQLAIMEWQRQLVELRKQHTTSGRGLQRHEADRA
jgi:hypothetical protein